MWETTPLEGWRFGEPGRDSRRMDEVQDPEGSAYAAGEEQGTMTRCSVNLVAQLGMLHLFEDREKK